MILDLGVDFKEKEGGFYKEKKKVMAFLSDIVKKHYLNVIFIMTLS